MTNLLERVSVADDLSRSLDEIEFTDEMIDALAHRLIFIFGSRDAAIEAMALD